MNKKTRSSLFFTGIIIFSHFISTDNCTIAESDDVFPQPSVSETAITQLSENQIPAVTSITSKSESISEYAHPVTTVTADNLTPVNTTAIGTTTVITNEQPEIEIIAPTSFILSLDPFMISHSESQIYSDNFYIINNSCLPVTVNVNIKLDCSEDVTLMDIKQFTTFSENDKKMWLGAVQSPPHLYNSENGFPVFDYGDITSYDETNTAFFSQNKELSFTFTLSKKGSDRNITGFRFIGTLSEIMDWNKEDVQLNMSYDVIT